MALPLLKVLFILPLLFVCTSARLSLVKPRLGQPQLIVNNGILVGQQQQQPQQLPALGNNQVVNNGIPVIGQQQQQQQQQEQQRPNQPQGEQQPEQLLQPQEPQKPQQPQEQQPQPQKPEEPAEQLCEGPYNTKVPCPQGGGPNDKKDLQNVTSPKLEIENYEGGNPGSWMIHSENAGVAAMQYQLMPNTNKAVWFDATNLGPSAIRNNPPFCRPLPNPENPNAEDCFSHAVEYDIETARVRTLKLKTDPWCSSGGLDPNGDLISTGGFKEGIRSLRKLSACPTCDFEDTPNVLSADRWYATQQMLENGSFILIGGRNAHNYEILAPYHMPMNHEDHTPLLLLAETEDEKENNLYPFVHLLPDGNLFVFANTKSTILDPYTGNTIRDLPDLPGGSRNYPASGMSVLLPLKLTADQQQPIDAEVLICGGNSPDAFKYSELPPRVFYPALKDCGRLVVTKEGAEWEMEDMPSERVMGDMLILPNGDILIINGAKAGTSGWEAADVPNLTPVLYRPDAIRGERFETLKPSQIPRMYHSVAGVLPDGRILVAGSNTNPFYVFTGQYPTELRVEKFSPPYLAPRLEKYRLSIVEDESPKKLNYGQVIDIYYEVYDGAIEMTDIQVSMYPPPFTTHGYSHGQRLLFLAITEVEEGKITALAPPSGKVAPPGFYLLFVVHHGVPSEGMWVHVE